MSWTRNEEAEAAKKQLAQEALKILEQAEQLEQQEEWAKAAYNYQQAAEKLQRSGYALQFIEELYNRVTICNKRIKLAKKADQIQDKARLESLQQQAFSLMDIATTLKKEKRYSDAVEQYQLAINLLTETGWTAAQLESIRGELNRLHQLIASSSQVPKSTIVTGVTKPTTVATPAETIVVPSSKIQTIKQLEERRHHEEEIQQSAFRAIDEGKKLSVNRDYDAAIQAYHRAIEQLISIGWTDQTTLLLQVVQELEQHRKQSGKTTESSEVIAQPNVPTFQTLDGAESLPPLSSTTHNQAITQFEEKRKKEKDLMQQAFAVIEDADKCVQNEDWDGAIEKCNLAIDFFNKSGWQGQTNLIYSILAKAREEKAKVGTLPKTPPPPGMKSATSPSPGLEESNVALQAQLEAQFAARRESVQEFETRKKSERQIQEKAFLIIQEAQELANRQKYGEASQKYIEAISQLNSIGWQQQTQQLQGVLNTLLERQRQHEMQQQTVLQQQITRKRDIAAMQEQTQTQITAEQEKMRQRQASLREVDAYKQKVNEVRFEAISLIEEAERFRTSRPPNFPSVIQKYEEAQRLLTSIQWQDQVQRLQDVMNTIHREYDAWEVQQASLTKKRQEEAAIQAALEKEMRKRMEEDARVKEMQQKNILEYQAKRNKEVINQDDAMNLLETAKKLREQGEFMDAVEKYKHAAQLFQSIGWNAQIRYIQKEIDATLEDYEQWQQEQTKRQLTEQMQAKKAKDIEMKTKQEELTMQKMSFDLKSMIQKASVEQERKVIHDKVQQADDYQKYLTKEQVEDERRKKMVSLREQVQRELAEKEVKMREEQERIEREKAKIEQDSLKDMIRKATRKPPK